MSTDEQSWNDSSGWAMGWAAFAAFMLMIAGVFGMINGIAAIANDTNDVFVKGQEWVFHFDIQTWGWIHLIMGIVLFLSGMGIFSGNVLARTIGVAVAALSAIANFMALPYYPIWAIVVITIDITIIWALTVHGRDLAEG